MKTACVYHEIDLDGWMSAAIVKHWWKTNNKLNGEKIEPLIFKDDELDRLISSNKTLDFIGYNYGQPIPDLSDYDKVIMCDISFPKEEMSKLWHNLNIQVIWIDHHKSAIIDNNDLVWGGETGCKYGIQDSKFAACELTWKYFFPNETMPEIVRLLGRYDCFGHKDTYEEEKVLKFQYAARAVITNVTQAYLYLTSIDQNNRDEVHDQIISFLKAGKAIYQYLCTEAKQVYKNGFEIILEEESWFDSGTFIGRMTDGSWKNRKFICINKERFNPINFGIDYHKDGYDGCVCFHYANGMYNFSLYNDNGKVDCSQIAKQFGGGGHKGASGMRLTQEQFNKLINLK